MKLLDYNNYAVVKSRAELKEAMRNKLCGNIIWEDGAVITLWVRHLTKWVEHRYVAFGSVQEEDTQTTGLIAYQEFYKYCGKEEVDKMKLILPPIDAWDANVQIHYDNIFYRNVPIIKNIYEFDANSSFTYGIFELPKGFEKLQEYAQMVYDKKRTAKTKIERSRYKNLQNFLIGYFNRVKGFVSTRSEIIGNSNDNIGDRMKEIQEKGGLVYISNTDSIVTDEIGADVMSKYLGDKAGQFKLEGTFDRLFYKSSNCYQLNDKVVWSGVKKFARENTDFFSGKIAEQYGNLVDSLDFIDVDDGENTVKLGRVKYGEITVEVFNLLGELIDKKHYKLI